MGLTFLSVSYYFGGAMPAKLPNVLTRHEERFVEEYLVLNNGSAAVRRAYPRSLKWADASVAKEATRLLRRPCVAAVLAERRGQLARRYEVTQERIIQEFARIAFSDHRDVFTWGPDGVTVKPSSELSEDAARAIAEISETTTAAGVKHLRIKFHDKKGALDSLAERLWPVVNRNLNLNLNAGATEALRSFTPAELRVLLEAILNKAPPLAIEGHQGDLS